MKQTMSKHMLNLTTLSFVAAFLLQLLFSRKMVIAGVIVSQYFWMDLCTIMTIILNYCTGCLIIRELIKPKNITIHRFPSIPVSSINFW